MIICLVQNVEMGYMTEIFVEIILATLKKSDILEFMEKSLKARAVEPERQQKEKEKKKGSCITVFFTFGGVDPLRPAAVLGVVVDEHVVRDRHQVPVHPRRQRDHHLEGELLFRRCF